MTDIEKKALALVNEAAAQFQVTPWESIDRRSFLEDVICRAIEQHEAFRQEVSDALSVYQKAASTQQRSLIWDALTRFIIAKPDPLVEIMDTRFGLTPDYAEELREALAERGGKIVWETEQ